MSPMASTSSCFQIALQAAGVSLVSARDTFDKIEVVNKWPGKQEVRDKIPSIILYRKNNQGNSNFWGYEVTHSHDESGDALTSVDNAKANVDRQQI
jgi:hypothetical protein